MGSKDLDGLDLHDLLSLKDNPEDDLYHPDFYVIGYVVILNEWMLINEPNGF